MDIDERVSMGIFTWFGRMILWVVFFPIGIWRSLRHHRKKAEKRAVAAMRREIKDEQR